MDARRVFESVRRKLKADFEGMTDEVGHAGMTGRQRERLLIEQHLSDYSPATVKILHSAEVVSSDGQVSGETDIVFADPSTPPLVEEDETNVVPVELAHGVLEVKSNLSSADLEENFEKVRKIKSMPKEAYAPPTGDIQHVTRLYGEEWPYFPSVGFIFAYESASLTTLSETLRDLQDGVPRHEWLDGLWILDRGMLVYWTDEEQRVEQHPKPGSRLRAVRSENPIPFMTIQLQYLLQNARSREFRIQEYLDGQQLGEFVE